MLGQPVSMLVPQVVGFKLTGTLREGATATDLVLTATQMLRKKGVVGKFVEYYGAGLAGLPLADRATLANMAPEYGATCGLFPIDAETIRYLKLSGRPASTIRLVEAYAKAQGMFHTASSPEADVFRHAGAGPVDRRAEPGWPATAPGPGAALRSQSLIPRRTPGAAGRASPQESDSRRSARAGPICGRRGRNRGRRRRGVPRARQRFSRVDHPWLGRDRGDHELHQYLKPVGDGRGGAGGQESRRARAPDQALGQGQPGSGLEGRDRLPQGRRTRHVPRPAPLQPGRLWLHHLHRQLGTAPHRDLRVDPEGRPGGRGRLERQSQLRRADQSRRSRQLSGFAPAGRRLCPGRHDGHRFPDRAARHRPARRARCS